MKVSVTIPCRNEERYIERCVRSVLSSDYSGTIRVLVCDGKSDDRTQEIVRSLAQTDQRVELLINEKQTTPFALNLGIRYARDCDVHIILGAHAEIATDYIRKCVEHLQRDHSIGCVGGILDNVNEDRTSEMIAKAMSSPFGVGSAHFRTGAKSGFVDTVAFGAYRKEVFEKVGYFDEELVRNQDDEFNYRIAKAGFRIYLDPEIRARYFVRAAFGKLWRQYYQYGLWKVYVNKKHGAITTLRQLVPPGFVLFLFCTPLALFSYLTLGLWMILWGLYFSAAIVATIIAKATLGELGGVLISFFILHFSYGLGYLTGICRFMIMGEKPGEKHITTSR
jgi:glycosyltransferase involved in cell wall biosynthesis